MKIIVLVLLAAIVIALFSGLFFLAKDKDHPPSPRLLTALKVRVSLSILLVVVLVVESCLSIDEGTDGAGDGLCTWIPSLHLPVILSHCIPGLQIHLIQLSVPQ